MAKSTYPKRFAVLVHQRVTRYELEDVRAYARLATSLMTGESAKHSAHVDSVVAGMSDGEREAYYDNNSDSHELMLRRFPNQQQSLVVLTYNVSVARHAQRPLSGIRRRILSIGTLKIPRNNDRGLLPKSLFERLKAALKSLSCLFGKGDTQCLWSTGFIFLPLNAMVRPIGAAA